MGVADIIKAERVLTYASLNKLTVGSPHEPHSHLLEANIKAVGFKLWVDKNGVTNTISLINDFAKYICGLTKDPHRAVRDLH